MHYVRRAGMVVAVLLAPAILMAQQVQPERQNQQQPAPANKKNQGPSPNNRLTIEVTGGDSNKPVENASVYVKMIEQHLLKDKKFEVNVKTNEKGIAHVPDAPMGRVEIQIVAEGWKTFGHWFDITEARQVIKIHLDKPPKWY